MPKQLALILCSLFVFVLLKYDRKQNPNVFWTLWLPTLWMLSIGSRSIDTWLGVTGGSRFSGGVLDPLFQGGLLVVACIVLAGSNINWSVVIRENRWLFLLLCFMLLSAAWSDDTTRSLRSWVKELTAVTVAFVLLIQPEPKEALLTVLRRTVYILIPFSILLIKYYQDLGVVYSRWTGEIQWTGVTLQKNALGRLCLISAFFFIWTFSRRWTKTQPAVGKYQTLADVGVLWITLWLFKGPSMWAASATALYALGCGLITFAVLLWLKKRQTRFGPLMWSTVMIAIIVVGTVTPFVGGSTVATFTSAVGRDTTLTGRTEIWNGLLPDVQRAPFLGYGFASFWTPKRIGNHDIGEAHNGYLEVCLGLGFLGLLVTARFLLACTRKIALQFTQDYDWANFGVCFLIMVAVHNITESSFDSFTRTLMGVLLLLAVTSSPHILRQPRTVTLIEPPLAQVRL